MATPGGAPIAGVVPPVPADPYPPSLAAGPGRDHHGVAPDGQDAPVAPDDAVTRAQVGDAAGRTGRSDEDRDRSGHGTGWSDDPGGHERPVSSAPLVAIIGPTGVGKTAAAVSLARRFGGEVVNADSRYLYRDLDVGVAKPTAAERGGIPHHLIDILGPTETMTLARYQDLALAAISDILARGAVPFLVGGTPLYVKAVVEGWRLPRVPPDPALRERLEATVRREGVEPLVAELRAVDPEAAGRAAGNPRRVIRALEVFAATGEPMSRQGSKGPPPYRTLTLALTLDRATLYARVDARADRLLAAGLADEVRALLAAGVPPDAPAMSSIGYRQLVPAILGDMSLGEAVERVKLATHRYVRHQETWLRQTPAAVLIDTADPAWPEIAAGAVGRHVATS